jgi:ABC-type multidrug transport system fused ATPase/permease subunit
MILNAKIQQGFIRYLREETYTSILQSNWSFFLHVKKSNLINTMTTEVNRVSGGVFMLLQFLAALVFTVIQIVFAYWLSPKMTLFVLLFGISMVFCSRSLIKKSNTIGSKSVELSNEYLGGMTDQLNAIKEIKTNTLEASHIKWFHQMNEKMESNILELVKLKTISQFTYKLVSAILIAFFVFLSVRLFKSQPGELLLINIIFARLWPRFTGIQSSLEQMGSMLPSFNVLINLQKQCLDSREITDEVLGKKDTIRINNEIECSKVYFRYNKKLHDYALKNINLKIPANKMTAIVGHSGAGKSTLIDILTGLNQPESGEVLIDGVSLKKEDLLSFRRTISYVPQDPSLFNSTIRENLLIINESANEEELWEALDFAAATDFVKRLPEGLETLIGDRGIKLSGGERQRIVLARAILKNPSILVLDEATSALDSENEEKIQEALKRLKGKRTLIVIAHRLSTIKDADQVIVLDHGEITQQGGFLELAAEHKGVFKKFLKKQSAAV